MTKYWVKTKRGYFLYEACMHNFRFVYLYFMKGGLVKAGLDVAQIWLDGDETLVNTVDRDGNMLPISLVESHALTHDPLVVLVSF